MRANTRGTNSFAKRIAHMFMLIHLMVILSVSLATAETMSPQAALTTMHYAEAGMSRLASPLTARTRKPSASQRQILRQSTSNHKVPKLVEDSDADRGLAPLQFVSGDTPEQLHTTGTKARAGGNQTRPVSSSNLKRPYDLQFMSSNHAEMYGSKSTTLDKSFYVIQPTAELSAPTNGHKRRKPTVVVFDDDKLDDDDDDGYGDTLLNNSKKPTSGSKKRTTNYKSELVRTQHRAPWLWRQNQRHGRPLPRYTTMPPVTLAVTTEYVKLLSSAHSPVTNSSFGDSEPSQYHHSFTVGQTHRNGLIRSRTRTSRAPLVFDSPSPPSVIPTHPFEGRVVSPEIVVQAGGPDQEESHSSSNDQSRPEGDENSTLVRRTSNVDHKQQQDYSKEISSSIQFDDDQQLSSRFRPVTFYNGKKPVTIILQSSSKHHQHQKRPPPPQPPPPPVQQQQHVQQPVFAPSTRSPVLRETPPVGPKAPAVLTTSPYLVRLISKQKHKYDDKVLSPTLTVVDNDANRLPPNSTSVHNNKLVVAIRPGRPKRRPPPTTQFPVYNIVAGITPPYNTNPSPSPQWRPHSQDGSIYGLLKPTSSPTTTAGESNQSSSYYQTSSQFGAPHIKFPAAEPTSLQPEHVSPGLPEKFNLTVPESANIVTPNKVPDKILLETGEETHNRPPNDAVVVSDSHNISRPPGGSNSTITNQDGVMRLKHTTKRPGSRPTPTQRVNIMSANTTVVTTNPEELHDVLSNFIAGHHQHHNAYHDNNRPSQRPGIMGYILGIFNNSILTSVMALLTLVKTMFVALLVMFLPPMALAAAIIQTINLG